MAERKRQHIDNNNDNRGKWPRDHRWATDQHQASSCRRPEPVSFEMACFHQNADNQQKKSSQNVQIVWKLHPIDLNDRTADAQQQPRYYSRKAYSATGMEYSNRNDDGNRLRAFPQDERNHWKRPYLPQNFDNHRSRPHDPSHISQPWKRGPYYPYAQKQKRISNERRQSSYQEGTYSRLDQSESEQVSDGIFTSRSSRERTSAERFPIPRKRVRSEGDSSNQPVPQPPKPGPTASVQSSLKVNAINTQPESRFPRPGASSSTRVESEADTSNQRAPQPAKPGTTSSTRRHLEGNANKQTLLPTPRSSGISSVRSKSVVPTSGENQAEQLSQNSEHGSQRSKSVVPTSWENQAEQLSQNSEHRSQSPLAHDNRSNQQPSSSPRPGLNSSMKPPSLVRSTVKKQSKQSLQKSKNVSKIKMEEDRKLIRLVFKHPHLYDPKDSAYRDGDKKQKSWIVIGETLGMTWNACQSNWKSLRIRNTKISRLLALGEHVPEEDKQLVDDMSFIPPTRSSTQGDSLTRRENHDSDDQLLIDSFARELRKLAPNQKRLFRSKIYQIFSEFCKAD